MTVAEKTCLRGLFDKDDDQVHPLVNNSIFKSCPNGMRFETKEVRTADRYHYASANTAAVSLKSST